MSFPTKIFGDYGDEKDIHASKFLPYGQGMELPDNRLYRYIKAGATALDPGKLVNGPATVTSHDDNLAVPTARAIGATTVTVTTAGTAVTLDQYAGGYLYVNDVTGEGHVYKVKSNLSAGSASTLTITLEPGDPIKVALVASTSEVGLRKSQFDSVVLRTAGTMQGSIVGVPPVSIPASSCGWVQTRGPAAIWTDGTLVAGQLAVASSVVDGTVGPWTANSAGTGIASFTENTIGTVLTVAASTDYSLIDLCLE